MNWLDRLICIIRPPPRPAPPGPGPVPSAAAALLAAVNRARAAHGLPPLKADPRLDRCAGAWAAECARIGKLSHFGPAGTTDETPWTRIRAAGVKYKMASENGAAGQRTADQAVADWVGEKPPGITGHRDNVLSKDWTHCGGGMAVGRDGQSYWIQDYAAE